MPEKKKNVKSETHNKDKKVKLLSACLFESRNAARTREKKFMNLIDFIYGPFRNDLLFNYHFSVYWT